jgi:ACR3 family arsenite efflux pump ArsB
MKSAFVLKLFTAQYFVCVPIAASAALDGLDSKSATILLGAFIAIPVVACALAAYVFKIERKNSNEQRIRDLIIYALSGLLWFLLISYTLHIRPFASVPLALVLAAITLIVFAKFLNTGGSNEASEG